MSDKEPDILLLDIQMPGKNGMVTAKELHRKKAIGIFVTALDDFVFQAFDVGAFQYLIKPFDDGKFVEVLQNAVPDDNNRGEHTLSIWTMSYMRRYLTGSNTAYDGCGYRILWENERTGRKSGE